MNQIIRIHLICLIFQKSNSSQDFFTQLLMMKWTLAVRTNYHLRNEGNLGKAWTLTSKTFFIILVIPMG